MKEVQLADSLASFFDVVGHQRQGVTIDKGDAAAAAAAARFD